VSSHPVQMDGANGPRNQAGRRHRSPAARPNYLASIARPRASSLPAPATMMSRRSVPARVTRPLVPTIVAGLRDGQHRRGCPASALAIMGLIVRARMTAVLAAFVISRPRLPTVLPRAPREDRKTRPAASPQPPPTSEKGGGPSPTTGVLTGRPNLATAGNPCRRLKSAPKSA
jgi:hypothetical protein